MKFFNHQSSKDALDGHEDHGAGTLLGDLPGSVSDWVLSLEREEEDRREVVDLGNARFPAADGLKKLARSISTVIFCFFEKRGNFYKDSWRNHWELLLQEVLLTRQTG